MVEILDLMSYKPIFCSKLSDLDKDNNQRRAIASVYLTNINEVNGIRLPVIQLIFSMCGIYFILHPSRTTSFLFTLKALKQ